VTTHADSTWPGEDRRRPSRRDPNWVVREPLARWLEAEGRSATGQRVLDVGCGVKPYLPFFATAREYVGVDVVETEAVDLVAGVELLPIEDGAFDLVLCIQVLEHVDDPAQAIRELHRVTRPGGRVLLSTHGVQVYHPAPTDYWRWTHTGLARLFETSAQWRSVSVVPAGGTCACLGMLLTTYLHLAGKRLHALWASHLASRAINRLAGWLDSRVASLREPRPGALIANYHVVAER
jgi:SAM-dependent methyltransferase